MYYYHLEVLYCVTTTMWFWNAYGHFMEFLECLWSLYGVFGMQDYHFEALYCVATTLCGFWMCYIHAGIKVHLHYYHLMWFWNAYGHFMEFWNALLPLWGIVLCNYNFMQFSNVLHLLYQSMEFWNSWLPLWAIVLCNYHFMWFSNVLHIPWSFGMQDYHFWGIVLCYYHFMEFWNVIQSLYGVFECITITF